jgi:uncharacterized protein
MERQLHPLWEKVAEAMNRATGAADRSELETLFTEDAVVWHNFDDLDGDRDRLITSVASLHGSVPDLRVEVLAQAGTASGFVQRQVFRGSGPGGELALHSCVVATVTDDGRISRLDEYVDTAQTRPLRPPKV